MESKALALGKQVKAEALNSSIHQTRKGWRENWIFKRGYLNELATCRGTCLL